jgi:hypothetical protein
MRSGSLPRSAPRGRDGHRHQPVLLRLIPAINLTVSQVDVRTGKLLVNGCDLVTCRALLHQIAEDAPAVLAQMACIANGQ